MAENTERTKELTSTQEGIIAGLVLLFFGLLYWYLNPWQSEPQSVPILAEQTTTGNIQRHSLADTSSAQANSTTTASTDTSQTQTVATQTVNNTAADATATSPQPQTTTQTTSPTSATAPTATSTTSNAAMSGTAAEPVLTAAALAEPTTPAKPTPATSTEATATASAEPPASSPVDTSNIAPASSTPSAAASPSTQTTAETSATPETPASEAKATEASTSPTQTTATTAAQSADTATTTTTAKPEPAPPITTNTANKLELAPGSPEAKLQSYLEQKTLETPVSMDGIQFEAKTAKLTKESDATVLLLAALLAQYPEANFLITSYTTETGNENQNSDELSLIRAQTLGESLVKAGVNAKRITIMGMGKRPSPDPTSVASKKSQHIEISVIQ